MIYQEFIAMNEEAEAFDPDDKLRFAIHEIVCRLKFNVSMEIKVLSEQLETEFNIHIEPELLKILLNDWDLKKNYDIFKKEDNNWLIVWGYQNIVKHKIRDTQSFGKHRPKKYTTNTNAGGYWYNNVWYPYGQYYGRGDFID